MSDSDEEFDLFKAEVAGVKRLQVNKVVLKRKDNVDPAVRQNAEKAKQQEADELSDPWSNEDLVGPDDYLSFKQIGVQETQYSRLRQGKLPVEAELDLHGMKQEAARLAIVRFLRQAQQHQARVVCIVHGKGFLKNGREPILKSSVNHWLKQLPHVLAFCSAQPKDGGLGAVYVLVKQQRTTKA